MICTTLTIADFLASPAAAYVRDHLLRPGRDFEAKLNAWIDGSLKPAGDSGHIALVEDHGEIVGWARTEHWFSGDDVLYDTLEAFVAKPYRLRGIASYASCGLHSSALHDSGGTVAVFHPHMLLVARRAGFWPVLFSQEGSQWRKVQ